MADAEPGEWDPFGRGWATALLVALTVPILLLARWRGAGAYGVGAIPFLILQFVLTGVIAGRAAMSVLRRLWRPLVLAGASTVGAAVAVVALQTWNRTPGSEPLLTRMFFVLLVPAIAWAVFAPTRTRASAWVTAVVSIIGFLIARNAGL